MLSHSFSLSFVNEDIFLIYTSVLRIYNMILHLLWQRWPLKTNAKWHLQESKAFFLLDRAPWWGINISSKTGTEAVNTGVTTLYHSKLRYTNHWPLEYVENTYKILYLKLYPRRRVLSPWKTGNPFQCSTTVLWAAFYGTDSHRLSDSKL